MDVLQILFIELALNRLFIGLKNTIRVTASIWGNLKPLQFLGLSSLGSSAGFERLHYLFERAGDPILVPGAPKQISSYFLNTYERWMSFDTNPLYAILLESIYCQGASRWSAHRVRADGESKFDAIKAAKEGRPVLFTGEVILLCFMDYHSHKFTLKHSLFEK